jgi:hypothetical protein
VPESPLSFRAYARHREALNLPGASAVAVSRAIASGRLRACLTRDRKGDIKIASAAAADVEWAAHTDHSRAPGDVKTLAANQPQGANLPQAPELPPGDTLADASNREKHWKAKKAELDFRKAAKELVSAADIARNLSTAAANIRTKIMTVPSKFKSRCMAIPHDQIVILDGLLREALTDLASAASGDVIEPVDVDDDAAPDVAEQPSAGAL